MRNVGLWLVVAVVVAMLAYPPWVYTHQPAGAAKRVKPAGYAPIFAPPGPESVTRTSMYSEEEYEFVPDTNGVGLDTGRLVLHLAIVVVIAGPLILSLRKPERGKAV